MNYELFKAKMDKISTSFNASANNVNELSISLEKIEKIIFMIRDISTKTDLLSLNASIEAVRAGQTGKGFAVVADEVARLAEKTQESISDIESAVDSFKDGFDELKSFFNNTKEIIKEISEQSNVS
ncbi:methyl-accepting chemotaxis protein [Fluviispira vulneris]|uniref:methyl-accepting chemotaxis protein n=1 Tax=Fluviispira vulneris TaxID=2763012 RepID=UPI001645864C|nr:methyl-accepting chemotaxis protein [Fluviispira vulneris]